MPIEAVIFDIGNVLIEWQPERFFDAKIGEARRRTLFDRLDLHQMNDEIDRGAPFRQTIETAAAQHPEFSDEIMCWYFNWIEMASPAIEHSVSLLRALQNEGVLVYALTNFGIESFEYAQTQYPFLTEFDRTYVSGRLGCVKPHNLIYEIVEADCKISPERLLFTDDRLENIQAAAARGWQVHHFDGAQGWADRLMGEGLLDATQAGAR